VNADELADAPGGRGTRIGRCLDRSHIASDDRGHEAGVDLLPADEDDIRRLDHRVGRFDHADQPARLDHSERVAHFTLFFVCHQFTITAERARVR